MKKPSYLRAGTFYPGFTLTGLRMAYMFKNKDVTERLIRALR
jgi:hypothetical protein